MAENREENGGSKLMEVLRCAAGGTACAGGSAVGEESPCIFRVNKKKLSDFSRLTKLG